MDTHAIAPHPLVGQARTAPDTPALLVDLDLMEANMARVAAACRAWGVAWRPHSKGHKTPEIALRQIAAGAIGITCAKLGEAEVMAAAGIEGIVIANQIVGRDKIDRLVALRARTDPVVCVDSIANLDALEAAFRPAGRRLKVAIEVNIGMNRAGIEPGAPVVAFAREIAKRPSLEFVGVLGWESQAATIADMTEKRRVVAEAVGRLAASAKACAEAGFAVKIVSCGGTGTFPFCIEQPGVTEVQVGGAIFSDMHYRTNYHLDFPPALTILTTVTSRPNPARIVTDAGKKAMSGDAAMPAPAGLPPVESVKLSAEHTRIDLQAPSGTPRVGDKIELVVGYSDTTVHLHEEIVAVRGGRIEAVWPIAARGKLK
ncbi:MAG: DSD1 family PLP-dependent enzyme [Alphaproteobacteria bacterium]|nr:DSD1 family PLP-dependent enzyme [Alphaproteobacteria bacterium]